MIINHVDELGWLRMTSMALFFKEMSGGLSIPRVSRTYPFASLFPEFCTEIRNVKFQQLAQLSCDNRLVQQHENRETLVAFAKILSRTYFLLSNTREKCLNACPTRFHWYSAFDNREYSSTCLLFEVVMWWNVVGFMYLEEAQEMESTPEAALFKAKSALGVFDVVARMFIKAWATKKELDVPIECRLDGNRFFTHLCLVKIYFYEIASQLSSLSLATLDSLDPTQLHKLSLLCLRLSHSADQVEQFLEGARNSVFIDKCYHSTIPKETSFKIYSSFAMLLFVNIALTCLKRKSLVDNHATVKLLLRIGDELVKRLPAPKKMNLVVSLLTKRQSARRQQGEELIVKYFTLCCTLFLDRQSFISDYNKSIVMSVSKKEASMEIGFWNLLDSYFLEEMDLQSNDDHPQDSRHIGFNVNKEAIEDEICMRLPWFSALKEHIFS